jgi:hypothetical protein
MTSAGLVVEKSNDRRGLAGRAARAGGLEVLPRVLTVLLAVAASLAACDGDGIGPDDGGPGDGGVGFDDHTVGSIESLEDFTALGARGARSTAVKFVITRFVTPGQQVRFLEADHYKLHDEWYWFRLLNNQRIDGVSDVEPVDAGRRFSTIAEIVAWARSLPPELLPLDLQFLADGRLYSPNFYRLALFSSPKSLGVGTVLHFPARPDDGLEEAWAIELEYQHAVTVAELVQLFGVLEDALPAEVGPRLKLLLRSPEQEALARQLEAQGSPLAERMLRYADVTVPGETEVYSEGLVAGRLKIVRRGESFGDTRSTDVLVAEDVPDFLPQCAALITAVPQTALAHVNILAKNRGIPNAFRAGILDDPQLDQLERANAPVIVSATAPRGGGPPELRIVPMTPEEFAAFRSLSAVPPTAVPPVDLSGVRITYDLETLDFADEGTWRSILGGKSTGFLALLDAVDVTRPPRPLGISIKPYVEHLETTTALKPRLESMLAEATFQASADVRLLVLEGTAGWNARYPDRPGFPAQFLQTRAANDVLRRLVEDGGVQLVLRSAPIRAATLEAIRAALSEHFGAYADEQGLRFRSSSNIEDAEGFNGAGLYTSSTGYLQAARLTGNKRAKTIERAILETWASYWGSEAFEERKLANVAHLSGAMGILVHANFQDELELGNGVFTYTILPPSHPEGAAVLELNAQEGALSVTNPPPGDPNLPEVVRMVLFEDEALDLERVRGSTLLPPGRFVLDEAQLRMVFDEARRVSEVWLAVENAALPVSQRRRTLTLDFELREVARGWPLLANGNVFGSRVVIKQARTLEPSLARVPLAVRGMPIPRDVLARALVVEQRICDAGALRATLTEVFTDPRKEPDLGFSRAPFSAFVIVDFVEPVPELGASAGQRRSAVHTAFSSRHPGMEEGGDWALELTIDPARVAELGLSRVAYEDGLLAVARDETHRAPASCSTTTLFSSPEAFLERILAR